MADEIKGDLTPFELNQVSKDSLYDFNIDIKQLYHLLQVWGYIELYQHQPYREPYLNENNLPVYKKITVNNGLTIYDYGNALAATRAEQWASGDMTNGKMITSIHKMSEILYQRNATEVLLSSYDQPARRAAWMALRTLGISIGNFGPTTEDLKTQERIVRISQLYMTPTLTAK